MADNKENVEPVFHHSPELEKKGFVWNRMDTLLLIESYKIHESRRDGETKPGVFYSFRAGRRQMEVANSSIQKIQGQQ